jgi:tetratricopeptide (TPR) repeat protein
MLAISLSHLGEALRQLGEHDRAEAVLTKALEFARRVGARSAESVASHYKARLHLDREEVAEAETWAGLALSICDETGNTFASAYALVVLGKTHLRRGRAAEAIDCQQQALGIARSSQERHPEVCGHNALAETLLAFGDFAGAANHADLAHRLAARSDYRVELGRATLTQARIRHAKGEQALEPARQAWQLLHGTGHRRCTAAAAHFLHELGQSPGEVAS